MAEFGSRASEHPWHSMSVSDVIETLESRTEGLTDDEVRGRRERYGANELPKKKPPTLAALFLRQFRDPLIYILLAAAVVSLATAHFNDAVFIFVVLLVNAAIGTIQERKAERSADALQKVMRIVSSVRRDGSEEEVDSIDLVPGDIVMLTAGSAVPADLRLIRAEGLRLDESLLTGESMPLKKNADEELAEETRVADRRNMAFAGSAVTEGRAEGVVTATGRQTQIGEIAESLAEGESEVPPLVIRMKQMSRMIGLFVLGSIIVLGIVQFAKARPLEEIFFLAVALAVAAIPEGLPISITVALAVASRRMSHRRVIVRRLPAVEGLGTCTLIASDKTGTLTANRLTIARLRTPDGEEVRVSGSGLDPEGEFRRGDRTLDVASDDPVLNIVRTGALTNEARLTRSDQGLDARGDAVDVAFLVLAGKAGVSRQRLLEESPEAGRIAYESKRKYSASFHEAGEEVIAHVKGAAEVVALMCEGADQTAVEKEERVLAEEGFRVLALAAGPVERSAIDGDLTASLKGLRFLGLVGLIDPLREEVREAIDKCRDAGVDVRMITGDHPATGLAIARQLGMAEHEDEVMTGAELEAMERDSPAELESKIASVKVFTRVAPSQKTGIVSALQRSGHFVAVTGDGVNDAPALRTAHIGVAMGASGTDVARGASDLILTDDNFASIVNGIEEGRVAYSNVRKVTWLLVSMGAAEISLFFFALLANVPLPLTAVQVLWLNLVTNGIQDKALAFEKGEPGILKQPPRPPGEGVFDRRMIEQIAVAGIYTGAVGFAVFYYLHVLRGMGEVEARNLVLLLMVLFENVHTFNCRSETRSIFRIPLNRNWLLLAAVVVAQLVHIAAMFTPGLRDVLDMQPVSLRDWLVLLPVTLTLVLVVEAYKRLRRPQ
ncbi:MAG TPA: HAD-IC family P-type ATPase [Thermoanaerobaculia bacterium]